MNWFLGTVQWIDRKVQFNELIARYSPKKMIARYNTMNGLQGTVPWIYCKVHYNELIARYSTLKLLQGTVQCTMNLFQGTEQWIDCKVLYHEHVICVLILLIVCMLRLYVRYTKIDWNVQKIDRMVNFVGGR